MIYTCSWLQGLYIQRLYSFTCECNNSSKSSGRTDWCAPGKEEGLPDVVILGAHNPVLCAEVCNVLAAVAIHSVGDGIVFAQVDVLTLALNLQ